ncbi:MAG: methylated-DNA--[protein]-cysteine S-methyltransferase [Syntrophales bacterium]|nr:methylated-DNA--[protein]-cysteine S-methyltransferase [Syntrophales bacterium]MDD5640275.1 methylated-DNA--[protein]-cysteine S-methyltransferase [Syntrophales bacterium]
MKTLLPAPTFYCLRQTPLASVAVLWAVHRGRPRIVKTIIYRPEVPMEVAIKSDLGNSQAAGCPEIDRVAEQIEAFLNGAAVRFSLDSILLERCSDFQQQVLRAEHGIPRGKVSAYQLIAGVIGRPGAARAVGTALATNPFPIIIPCHRAVRSDRTLGGYQGGLKMKRALLEMEGISFDQAGRVAVEDFFYSTLSA